MRTVPHNPTSIKPSRPEPRVAPWPTKFDHGLWSPNRSTAFLNRRIAQIARRIAADLAGAG